CFPADAVPALLARQEAALARAAGEQRAEPTPEADRKPTSARDLFLDAASAIVAGKYSVAVPLLEKTIASEPNHAAAHYCLAHCRQHLGQCERALERYDIAERLLPGDPRPAFQRGVIYGLQSKRVEAEKEFTTAIELDPDHPFAHTDR